jgi:adenylosuccinate lyase
VAEKKYVDLISKLKPEERASAEKALRCISPDDSKYRKTSEKLADYLSASAEWMGYAFVQKVLLEKRVEFGKAEQKHLDEVISALDNISCLNMDLIEKQVTKHDQLAVLEDIGRFVSEETKALLHPGTTSYDVIDTARAYLFKKAWFEVIRPEAAKSIEKLCTMSERTMVGELLQVGRTHLQATSPVPLCQTFSVFAARIANRLQNCDAYFNDLRGKISGIVGTGASIDMVIGEEQSIEFEKKVLQTLGLKPDYTATQITQKERYSDLGHGLVTLTQVAAAFADDVRKMYSTEIGELTSRDNQARLGGSSADATKNNPIEYEHIIGTAKIIKNAQGLLYDMIASDFQRDLTDSVPGRTQPQEMMVETLRIFERLNGALDQLSINEDRLKKNLQIVRDKPGEAMTAILRGERWVHSTYGVGHDFVKEMSKKAQKEAKPLLGVCLGDGEFKALYEKLPEKKKDILAGKIELYIGSAKERTEINLEQARKIASAYSAQ